MDWKKEYVVRGVREKIKIVCQELVGPIGKSISF